MAVALGGQHHVHVVVVVNGPQKLEGASWQLLLAEEEAQLAEGAVDVDDDHASAFLPERIKPDGVDVGSDVRGGAQLLARRVHGLALDVGADHAHDDPEPDEAAYNDEGRFEDAIHGGLLGPRRILGTYYQEEAL